MKELYPDSFYRGISPANVQDGFLLPETFHSDGGRDDGFEEISITWNDEEAAFRTIASQINDRTGKLQFSAGISKIKREEFDIRMKPQVLINNIDYERRPTKNNQYHGNILVRENLTKVVKNMLKAQLALLAQECIIDNPYVKMIADSE